MQAVFPGLDGRLIIGGCYFDRPARSEGMFAHEKMLAGENPCYQMNLHTRLKRLAENGNANTEHVLSLDTAGGALVLSRGYDKQPEKMDRKRTAQLARLQIGKIGNLYLRWSLRGDADTRAESRKV
jgi:hypothetical protein